MPDIPEREHIEINEDGNKSEHKGYMFLECKICGCSFLVAKAMREVIDTCGAFDCGKIII